MLVTGSDLLIDWGPVVSQILEYSEKII